MEGRLPTHVWVGAHLRWCHVRAIPVTVARKGDAHAGTVMLKLNRLEHGCRVLTQMTDAEGKIGWLAAFEDAAVAEAEADAYIARAVARDPDLWVIEIEDREGRNPFLGKVM